MDYVTVEFESFSRSITDALDVIGASELISRQISVLIKPNLVTGQPHPITTSPECCEAVIEYVRRHSKAEIVLAEGCGDAAVETGEIFERLGYTALSERQGVPLVDLNQCPVRKIEKPECPVFPEIHLPDIAFTSCIVSVPVLKAHSLAGLTGTLKNMMGFAPPQYYSGQGGVWKKAAFHERMQKSLIDLNRYLVPDITVMDCSVGMAEYHLGGPHCDPPVNRIIAGFNPWEVDREAAGLLGMNWQDIGHVAVDWNGPPSSQVIP